MALRAVSLALLGAAVGVAAILTHARTLGEVLGVVATSAAAYALPGGWTTRFAFVAGWILVLVYALMPRAAGGYLIGSDVRGYTLLGFALVLLLFAIVTVRPLRPPPPDGASLG